MAQSAGFYKTIRIKKIEEEVKDFKIFFFEDGHSIKYSAGQYLTFVVKRADQEIRRSYSITSSPVLNEPLSIGVKRIPHGYFSQQLIDSTKVNDELVTSGSGGFFILPGNVRPYHQVFFFAAGSGITPIYSLLKTVLYSYQHLSVILVYSNSSPETTIFFDPLIQLKEQFTNRLQVEFLFSNAPDLINARLHRESLIGLLNRYSIANYSDTLFYVCGPLPYMRMCTYVLQQVHVPADNIKKENFIINQVRPSMIMPPDKETHDAFISFAGNEFHLSVHYPDSILQAAKRQGISLPYSCETGRCGNCVAHCVKGSVWLSNNEVLTDKELSNGLTLTCVGHPIGGDVMLEIKP